MKLPSRWILLPIVLSLGIWSLSLGNGFVWDDHVLIEKNAATLGSLSPKAIFAQDFWTTETGAGRSNYYRPLVTLSYAVDYALFGLNPVGYHLTNILLHTANVALVFLLLAELAVPAAFCAAAASIFAVHPALAESVAWVSGRTDLIATFWTLLSILALLAAFRDKRRDPRLLALSGALCLAALLSKESALVTPLLALTFAGLRFGSRAVTTASMLPFLLAGAAWLFARSLVLSSSVGAELSNGVSPLIGLLSLFHVWGNLLCPAVFRIEYGSPLTAQTLFPGAAFGVIACLWLVTIVASARASRVPRALAAAALIAFLPSVMAVLLKSMIGVRLVYTSAAFALPAAALVILLRPVKLRLAAPVVWIFCLLLGVIAAQRIPLWRSDQVLFQQALAAPDASTRSHLNLGIALYNSGDLLGAYEQLSFSIEPQAADQQHYMLGLLYTAAQCETKAEAEYRAAIAAKPDSYSPTHNLAGLLFTQGKLPAASELLAAYASRYPAQSSTARKQLAMFRSSSPSQERSPSNQPWCATPASLRELFRSPVSLNRQATELLRLQQLEMADVFIKAALRGDPKLLGAQLNQAQLEILRGNAPAASELLRRFVTEHPDDERAKQLLLRASQATAQGSP